METKKDIRKKIFAQRVLLTAEQLEKDSAAVMQKVMDLPAFKEAECIYVYMDYKGELSTKLLITSSLKLGKRVAAPKVSEDSMSFYYISGYEDLAPGYFGIPEPITGREAFEEDALLIIPGVAFDVKRHRVGYGKGFYDRYLEKHPKHTTIAAALDFQVVDAVESGVFDILPDMLITPTRSFIS